MDRNEFAEIISAKANASDLQTLLLSILKSRDFEQLNKNDMLIANDPKRFAASVVELYKDPILWSKLSQNGILFAQENFSANATGKLIGTMLNQLSLKPKTKINHLKLYSS